MKKEFSLKPNHIFSDVLKKGKKYNTNVFLLSKKNNNFEHIRIGISVPKKIGNAVTRNKIKRQVKAIISEDFSELASKKIDLIIMVKIPFLELDFNSRKAILSEKIRKFLKENNERK